MIARHPLADGECHACRGSGYAAEPAIDDGPDDEPGMVPCGCVMEAIEARGTQPLRHSAIRSFAFARASSAHAFTR